MSDPLSVSSFSVSSTSPFDSNQEVSTEYDTIGTFREDIVKIIDHNFQPPNDPKSTRELWSQIASCITQKCLGKNNKICPNNCSNLCDCLKHLRPSLDPFSTIQPTETLAKNGEIDALLDAFREVPGILLVIDQAIVVLGHLANSTAIAGTEDEKLLKQTLDEISKWKGSEILPNTCSILACIVNESSCDGNGAVQAILKSLFTPHRQISLPTCNMDAIIISETLNFPGRLVKIFKDLLQQQPGAVMNLMSTQHTITVQPIKEGFICVRPSDPNNGDNKKYLFGLGEEEEYEEIEDIEFLMDESNSKEGIIGLKIPVKDLNDVLLANLMQNVYGEGDSCVATNGGKGVVVSEGFIRSRELYYGTPGDKGFLEPIFCIDDSQPVHRFGDLEIDKLIKQAEELRREGVEVASTFFSQPNKDVAENAKIKASDVSAKNFYLDKYGGHVENMYLGQIDQRLKNLKENEVAIIGDRNWIFQTGAPAYLAVWKREGTYVLTNAHYEKDNDHWEITLAADEAYGEIGQLSLYAPI